MIVTHWPSGQYTNGMTAQTNPRLIVRQAVETITPFDAREKEHIDDILAWIDSGAELFRLKKPDIPPKHLVSYFVILDPDAGKILLIDHIKAQLWLPTGGHVLPGEDPKDAVIREAKEELSMPAVFFKGDTRPFFATVNTTGGLTPGHVDVSLWYILRGSVLDFVRYDKSEFTDVEWFNFEEILEMDPVIFDKHMRRFVYKLRQYLKASTPDLIR